MIYPCRCRRCRKRRTLNKHPDDYVQRSRVLCYHCDGELRLDAHRQTKEHKRTRCKCDAYWFPHRYDPKYCRFKVK